MDAFRRAIDVLTPRTLDEFERLSPLPSRDSLSFLERGSGGPFAVAIVGPFGSGKTTLARLLSEGFGTATWVDTENVQAIVENGLPDRMLNRVFIVDDADIFYYVSPRVRDLLSEFLTFQGARVGLIVTWSSAVEPRVEDELRARLRDPRFVRLSESHRLGAAARLLREAGPPCSELAERLENNPTAGRVIREAIHRMMFSKELGAAPENQEEDQEENDRNIELQELEQRLVSLVVDKRTLRKSSASWESLVRAHESLLAFRSRSCKCYGTDEVLKSICDRMASSMSSNYDRIGDCKAKISGARIILSSDSGGGKGASHTLLAWLCKDAGLGGPHSSSKKYIREI